LKRLVRWELQPVTAARLFRIFTGFHDAFVVGRRDVWGWGLWQQAESGAWRADRKRREALDESCAAAGIALLAA
jgi:hypothetical protein